MVTLLDGSSLVEQTQVVRPKMLGREVLFVNHQDFMTGITQSVGDLPVGRDSVMYQPMWVSRRVVSFFIFRFIHVFTVQFHNIIVHIHYFYFPQCWSATAGVSGKSSVT